MKSGVKSGKEILDEFFQELANKDNLDKETVTTIVGLYNEEKLSDKNLSNALSQLRESEPNDKD